MLEGYLPYLKQSQVEAFFQEFHKRFEQVSYNWRQHSRHGAILDEFEDLGGLNRCPPRVRRPIVLWMVLCYLGEPGNYGWYGRNRNVFYSDTAAPMIERMFRAAADTVRDDVEEAAKDRRVESTIKNADIASRYETLLDLVGAID